MSTDHDKWNDRNGALNAEACLRGLATIRRRALYLLICFLLMPLSGAVIGLARSRGIIPWGEKSDFSVVAGMMGVFVVSMVVHNTSRCPRCRKSFFIRGSYGNPFARRCLNCKLLRAATTAEELAD